MLLAKAPHKVALLPCKCIIDRLRPQAEPDVSIDLRVDGTGRVEVVLDFTYSDMPTQAWYADDSQAIGRLLALRAWWDLLCELGPGFGYFPKPSKTYLVVKPHLLEEAQRVFAGTGIVIAGGGQRDAGVNGHRDLGAAIGTVEFVANYLRGKVLKWVEQMECLSDFARTQPHAAHSAFVHGVRNKWTFTQRTMQSLHTHMGPLEDTIRSKFIPALLGKKSGFAISDDQRSMFALPARWGGMGIDNPVSDSPHKYADSLLFTEQLKCLVKVGAGSLLVDPRKQKDVEKQIEKQREVRYEEEFNRLCASASYDVQRALVLAREKGASSVFTMLPYRKYGFCFGARRDFNDLIALRYRLPIYGLPPICACGKPYSLDHSQICQKGGFIHMRHDAAKHLWEKLCSFVWRDVEDEPMLVPLAGEVFQHGSAKKEDSARSDVRVRSFFGACRNAFFEFRAFYAFARTHKFLSPDKLYIKIANERRREYAERVQQVEDADFTPMIISSSGGMGKEMQMALKHLSNKLAGKKQLPYCQVVGFVRAMFSFEMMRMALICLRGSRSYSRTCEHNEIDEMAVAISDLRL